MTPAARVQAAIEVLDRVLADEPVEKALTGWARRSRFAGSKDRRAVRDHVFQALRTRRACAARGGALTGRGLMLGAMRIEGTDPGSVFTGEGYAPAPLAPDEGQSRDTDPDADWNLPDWLIEEFKSSLKEQAFATAQALTDRAPVMCRVNQRRTTTDPAIADLAKDGITAIHSSISDTAIHLTEGAPKLAQSAVYKRGDVELQDGASQAAMDGLDIPNGARVLDYCAGGGGKTLALAAQNEATWYAHDVSAQRMMDLPARAARARVEVARLDTDQLPDHAPFDVVLCDAPCSGSGTWRRTPDAKWRLTAERLAELTDLQREILLDAAKLVSPAGMLVYATCSVLDQENNHQIDRFVAENPAWISIHRQIWPVSPDSDGFFIAHLRRA